MKTTVKVCGMKDPKLIDTAIKNGASYIGFIVNYPKSPRSISINELQNLTKQIPIHIKKVAVMVNPKIEEVKEISNYCNVIQLHGDETENFIQQIKKETRLEVIKTIKVKEKKDLELSKLFPSSDIILFDTPSMGEDGEAFNFDLVKDLKNKKFFLAGKISKDNVKSVLRYTNNIDVNSSLETERGIKDPEKIIEFFLILKKYER